MIFNLLVLPLATGYYVLTRSFLFKFSQQRFSRQRLLFETIIFGAFALLLGFFIRLMLLDHIIPLKIKEFIYYLNPLKETRYSGTMFIIFILAVLLTEILNFLSINKEEF